MQTFKAKKDTPIMEQDFYRKQRFKLILMSSNFTLDLMIHLLTDYFSIELMMTWMILGSIILLGIYKSTPQRDFSGVISGFVLAISLQISAAVDPKSLSVAESANSIAIFCAYLMVDADSRSQIAIAITNLLAWILYYWLSGSCLILSSQTPQTLIYCSNSKEIYTKLISNVLMALNGVGFIKYSEDILRSYKKANEHISNNLKTQEQCNKELKETIEMNDNFLMAFSHELKNPLNALLGSIELARDEECPQEIKFLISNAEMSGRMLLHLLTNILDSGKIQLNKLDVNLQAGNFAEYIQNFWRIASMLIKSRNLDGLLIIKKDFPPRMAFDSHRLSQILLNLLSNALKFTEKGQIKFIFSFEAGTELPDSKFESAALRKTSIVDYEEMSPNDKNSPRRICITGNPFQEFFSIVDTSYVSQNTAECFRFGLDTSRFPGDLFAAQQSTQDGYIRIEVIDSGCGMNPAQTARLFERYSQVNQNTSKRQIGTGLGLWISKELCKHMNGDIKVTSQEGVGSSFVVMLKTQALPSNIKAMRMPQKRLNITRKNSLIRIPPPIVDMPSSSQSDKKMITSNNVRRALIAEDLVYNQEIYKRMLKKENIEAVMAKNGQEAVNLFKKAPANYFDFLLMDFNMPELDGVSASEIIRQHEEKNNARKSSIFIATGHCTPETRSRCLDRNGSVKATDVLIKPLTQADIKKICETTIS